MTDFDTILKNWAGMSRRSFDWRDGLSPPKPKPLPIPSLTDVEVLDEFCFFAVEYKEAQGRNSAVNDAHLVALFGELKRRNLFPE